MADDETVVTETPEVEVPTDEPTALVEEQPEQAPEPEPVDQAQPDPLLEAEARGRATERAELVPALVRARVELAAHKRNPGFDIARVLDHLRLDGFVGGDGQPDEAAITATIDALVPKANPYVGAPSMDGGVRTPPPRALDMNSLIRREALGRPRPR